MGQTVIETLYEWLDQSAKIVEQHTDEPYLDSLAIVMEMLFEQEVPQSLDEMFAYKLQKMLDNRPLIEEYKIEEIRNAIQLVILKGMKGSTQQQHLMTPESVAHLVGYLAEKIFQEQKDLRLFDPVCGTANLLTTVMSHLKRPLHTFASEIDPTLLRLALVNANLQKKEIEFFHQDSLRPFLIDPVDLVVADLPVGYYPDDTRAQEFKLRAKDGHSYAHHLLIEQSVHYTKKGGYLIFVVPHFLFSSDQAEQLHAYFRESVHIIGVLQLPDSAFVSKEQSKSILIIRKKGEKTENLQQPLLVQMPAFTNTRAMEDILGQMNAWFEHNQDLL